MKTECTNCQFEFEFKLLDLDVNVAVKTPISRLQGQSYPVEYTWNIDCPNCGTMTELSIVTDLQSGDLDD